jgi:hypothetical protein
MNLYTMVGSGIGSSEAIALSQRLAAWHDTMVAHERQLRGERVEELCDDECPHAEARALWNEAVETFGVRAQDMTFLRTRAMVGTARSREDVASTDIASGGADRGHRPAGGGGRTIGRHSEPYVRPSARPRAAALEL